MNPVVCLRQYVAIAITALASLSSAAASFDCAKSHTFVEKAICRNPTLSALDEKVAAEFATTLSIAMRPDEIRQGQRQWLSSVRNACGDVSCLRRVHEARLEDLAFLAAREARDSKSEDQTKACALDGLPPDFAVLAAGGYTGRPLNFQIDESGHVATHMDVTVHHPDKPVLLMLGAYEPTIWSVRRSTSTVIAGVFLSGYHRQAISGVDGIPVLQSNAQGPCGYFYAAGDGLRELNPIARRLAGKPAEMVYPALGGRIAVGEKIASDTKFASSGLKPIQSFRDESAPLAGELGLLEAVKKGQLREATPEDAKAWASNAAAVSRGSKDIPPVAGERSARTPMPLLLNAYVVLGKFRYPAGLYGANSATFLIPKGVPVPTGNPGHSTIWDFNTGRCSGGSMCSAGGGTVVIDIETTHDGKATLRRLQ